jgi:hypothetical protein
MRTTVRLDDQLLKEAKRVASAEGKTLTALLDESLRERIARTDSMPIQKGDPLPTFAGDGLVEGPGPETLMDNARLADLMDGLD